MNNKIITLCLKEFTTIYTLIICIDVSAASKLLLVVSVNLNSWYDSSQVILIIELVLRLSISNLSVSSRQKTYFKIS